MFLLIRASNFIAIDLLNCEPWSYEHAKVSEHHNSQVSAMSVQEMRRNSLFSGLIQILCS